MMESLRLREPEDRVPSPAGKHLAGARGKKEIRSRLFRWWGCLD